jgi:maltose O-acetyltransferase
VQLWGRPVVKVNGQLLVGDEVVLVSTVAAVELVAQGGCLEIGAQTLINYGCSIGATQLVRLGRNCRIGIRSLIMDNNYHRLEPERRDERPPAEPVILGDGVWLGPHVIVLPGVTIGAGSVVVAGSVVTRSLPPGCLAAGVPAQVIRAL